MRLSNELDMSIRQMARLAEMSEATLYHFTDGTRDMTGRAAARLCYHIEKKRGVLVNRDWLLTGKGKMLVDIHAVAPAKEDDLPVAAEAEPAYDTVDWKAKYYELLEKYTALLEERR